jgi:hypothetical protein
VSIRSAPRELRADVQARDGGTLLAHVRGNTPASRY